MDLNGSNRRVSKRVTPLISRNHTSTDSVCSAIMFKSGKITIADTKVAAIRKPANSRSNARSRFRPKLGKRSGVPRFR